MNWEALAAIAQLAVHWRGWAANRPHDKNFASLNAIRLFALAAASTANGLIDWLRATAFVDGGR
jgi:hypothetical protein